MKKELLALGAGLCLLACGPGGSRGTDPADTQASGGQSMGRSEAWGEGQELKSTVQDSFPVVYESERLVIRKISDKVYQHISYLDSEDFDRVPCNGMVVRGEEEAIVFDTPVGDESSEELLAFLSAQGVRVSAVVPTHFHWDCLSGLEAFHKKGIPSYANKLTIELARQGKDPEPQHAFQGEYPFKLDGGEGPEVRFFGEGHTRDNVVAYLPSEGVLFGGCLVKELGAGEGNLADANTQAWPETMKKIRREYPALRIVIPGHGKPGGPELLDYTRQMFE